MLLTDCLDEFIYDCECRHLAKGTLRNYRGQCEYLIRYLAELGIRHIEDVKPQHLRNFLKQKQDAGCKLNYVNNLLKAHKTMFNYHKCGSRRDIHVFLPEYKILMDKAR